MRRTVRHRKGAGGASPADGLRAALEEAGGDEMASSERCRRLEDHLRLILESTSDGYIVLDGDWAILSVNPAAEQLLGWSRAELLGQRLILKASASDDVPSGDISRLIDADGPPGVPHAMEAPMVDRQGEVFQARIKLWATDGGSGRRFHALFSKIGAASGGSEMMECAVGSIVTSSGVAIIGEDLNGRITTWNSAAEEMYGYPASEVVGRPGRLIIPVMDAAESGRLVAEARRGLHVPSYEALHLRSDGSEVQVSVTISPVRDMAGAVTGVSLIARDITEQRRAADAMDEALQAARHSEESSRRFLADAAHQLRTPIAGIRACADTLAGSGSVAEGEVLLDHMIEETSRAGRLIRGLLRMARVDRGVAPTPVPCDLAAVCASEVERLRIRSPQLEVEQRLIDVVPDELRLDPDVVHEILGNLLDNASRHARSRIGVEVRLAAPAMAEVRVTDDGPGLADDMVEGAFERFVSLDGRGGSGLGLPIARGLARSHGGDLTYEGGWFVLRLASGGARPAAPPAP
ncbi:MAG: PAS domain S-box protein [Acidimicrobiales bacterium]